MFGTEKYFREKLNFCTPVTLKEGIVWRTLGILWRGLFGLLHRVNDTIPDSNVGSFLKL